MANFLHFKNLIKVKSLILYIIIITLLFQDINLIIRMRQLPSKKPFRISNKQSTLIAEQSKDEETNQLLKYIQNYLERKLEIYDMQIDN